MKKEIYDPDCPMCDMQKYGVNQTLYVTTQIFDSWKEKHKGHYVLPHLYEMKTKEHETH